MVPIKGPIARPMMSKKFDVANTVPRFSGRFKSATVAYQFPFTAPFVNIPILNSTIQINKPGNKLGALNGKINATNRNGIGATLPNNAKRTLAFLLPFLNCLSPIYPNTTVPNMILTRMIKKISTVISAVIP